MFISECLGVNGQGHLTIGGLDTLKLAEEFGTPLYLMDENQIRKDSRRFVESIDKFYGGRGMVVFAGKAFSCLEMCRLVAEERMWLDVVSEGEIFTGLTAGFPAGHMVFHGNNKPPEELTYAVQSGVGRIVVDNTFELKLLEQIARSARKSVRIHLRIKPGIEAHTHEFIKTGGVDSKFGFALETGEAMAAIREASGMEHVELVGLHCHIGSQIFAIEPFEHAAEVMLELMAQAKEECGCELTELNLGGGFGIKYIPEHDPPAYERYMEAVSKKVGDTCRKMGLDMPYIMIEPGRSITGPAGITLYHIGAVKEIPGIRTYVTVDGGMTDNPRHALYGAEYTMVVANRAQAPASYRYTVAGRCCESDPLGHVLTQEARVGDILAVLTTGAYNYSMAGNYNRLPKPAVVFVRDGAARCVVRRESFEDIIRNDI